MNHLDDGFYVIDGSLGENAVAEIEDMAGSARGLVEHGLHPALDLAAGSEEDGGVEVPLDSPVATYFFPAVGEVDPPVEANDVAAASLIAERSPPESVPKCMEGIPRFFKASKIGFECGRTYSR